MTREPVRPTKRWAFGFRFTDHWNTSPQLDRTTVGEKSRTGQAAMIGFTPGAQYRF